MMTNFFLDFSSRDLDNVPNEPHNPPTKFGSEQAFVNDLLVRP
jgi:hypothetical protein